ncbi:MAG TPA: hypothetical protein PKJ08_04740 [Candidatus Cloacimonadota bacterium]|nr:hypothetical protein [Candidatus Cloacimonadota bacterium]
MKFFVYLGILFLMILTSCSDNDTHQMNIALDSAINKADSTIIELMSSLEQVKFFTEKLYENQNQYKGNPSLYDMYNNVFYKKVNNGKSAVFVTGFIPVNPQIKRTVYFTEPLEEPFMAFINNHPQAVQIYYNDKNSYNRIYPWFDVLSQYPQNTDITSFSFYYLADNKFNPEKKVVVTDEPYMDPAGRGWIFSIISPVYYQDSLEGVLGIDVNACNLFSSISELKNYSYMLLQESSTVISSSKDIEKLFNLPDKNAVKYIDYLSNEEVLNNQYKLSKSKNIETRRLFDNIKGQQKIKLFRINDREYLVTYKKLKTIDWTLVIFKKVS